MQPVPTPLRPVDRAADVAVALLVAAYAVAAALLQALKYNSWNWSTFDIANHGQFFAIALGRWSELSAPELSYFFGAIGLQPFLGVLFLIAQIIPSPYLYTTVMALFAAAGIGAFYLLARPRLGAVPAATVTLAWALNPFFNIESIVGFRYEIIGLPFIFLMFHGIDAGNRRAFWIGLIGGNFAKANLLVVNLVVCLMAARGRAHQPYLRRGAIVNAVWIVTAIGVLALIQAVAPNQIAGNAPPAYVINDFIRPALAEPGRVPGMIADWIASGRARWLFDYLAPLLFLPLAAPLAWVPFLLELGYVGGISLVMDRYPFTSQMVPIMLDYGYLFIHAGMFWVAGMQVAALLGLWRVAGWFGGRRRQAVFALSLAWLIGAAAFHYARSLPLFGPLPLTREFNLAYYTPTEHVANQRRMLAALPADKVPLLSGVFCEQADRPLGTRYLSSWTPTEPVAEVVLVDLYAFEFAMAKPRVIEALRFYLSRSDFGVVAFEDGMVRADRHAPRDRNDEVLAWLAANEACLSRNLPPPYTFGADLAAPPQPRYFSPTQLIDRDRAGENPAGSLSTPCGVTP